MSTNNILLYKSNCEKSYKFLEIANNIGLLKTFSLICIDGKEKYFKNEKGIKQTPTIIMIQMNTKLEGDECLIWLKNICSSHKSNNNGNNNNYQDTTINIPGIGACNLNNPTQQNDKYVSKNNVVKRKSIEVNEQNNFGRRNNLNQSQNINNNSPSVSNINNKLNFNGFVGNEMDGFSDIYAYLHCDHPTPKSFLEPTNDYQIYTAPEDGKLNKQNQDRLIEIFKEDRDKTKNKIRESIKEEHQKYNSGKINHKWYDDKN